MIPRITLTETPRREVLPQLTAQLMRFNDAASGWAYDGRTLVIELAHPGSGELLGGLWGSTSYTYLHVDAVFVPEVLRGTGVGRRLMEEAECEALRRGCGAAWLDTFSFQARGFYEKLGYRVLGELPNNPPGHTRYLMKKALRRSHTDR